MRTLALAFLVAVAAGCSHDKAAQKTSDNNALVDHEREIHKTMVDTHAAAAPPDDGVGGVSDDGGAK